MAQRQRLFLIDDDPAIYHYLRRHLTFDYEVETSATKRVLAELRAFQPDLVLLAADAETDKDYVLLRAIKARLPTPVLALLPSSHPRDLIAALDAGADDCIAKPFGVSELAARIKKLLRRRKMAQGQTPTLSAGGLQIDFVFHRAYRKGLPCALSGREWKLLQLLVDAKGGVLRHVDLLRGIWRSGKYEHMVTLRQTVRQLRRKIEPAPEHPVYLLTQPRIGYRFALQARAEPE